jgi:hypothetical protein
MYLARDLIGLSLSGAGLREFGQHPLFSAVHHTFIQSEGSSVRRPEVHALAEDALWRAISEWLAGRNFPTGSARDTISAAKRDGFDLAQRAQEFLSPRQFLR